MIERADRGALGAPGNIEVRFTADDMADPSKP